MSHEMELYYEKRQTHALGNYIMKEKPPSWKKPP